MSKRNYKNGERDKQKELFLKESRKIFSERFHNTGMPSVLIAQNRLETQVDKNQISPGNALITIRDAAAFSDLLFEEETAYKQRQDQKIDKRMAALEQNTNRKSALIISLSAGLITGLAFAVASPFISAFLQPTADEVVKRVKQQPPAAQDKKLEVDNSTHGNVDLKELIYFLPQKPGFPSIQQPLTP